MLGSGRRLVYVGPYTPWQLEQLPLPNSAPLAFCSAVSCAQLAASALRSGPKRFLQWKSCSPRAALASSTYRGLAGSLERGNAGGSIASMKVRMSSKSRSWLLIQAPQPGVLSAFASLHVLVVMLAVRNCMSARVLSAETPPSM